MKIYKFRSLGDCQSAERTEDILRTKKFWCSRFWEMNDPMEGIYVGGADKKVASMIFDRKAERLICSFSKKDALLNPLMWGYYANGFKGVAIEVEVADGQVVSVNYVDRLVSPIGSADEKVKKILTSKLKDWSHEKEARFITCNQEKKHEIGRITGLYVGLPYRNALNHEDIEGRHDELRAYRRRVIRLADECENQRITVHQVSFSGEKLRVEDFNRASFEEPP